MVARAVAVCRDEGLKCLQLAAAALRVESAFLLEALSFYVWSDRVRRFLHRRHDSDLYVVHDGLARRVEKRVRLEPALFDLRVVFGRARGAPKSVS